MANIQDTRFISMDSGLASSECVLTRIQGHENISSPFEYSLEFSCEERNIKPQDAIGKALTFCIDLANGEKKHYHGYISQLITGSIRTDGRRSYLASVVPWFWFFQKSIDSRIFQNMTATEIIELMFGEFGLTDYTFDLRDSYEIREYCVQYHESAFDFINRLLEEEGIYYFFKHEAGKHILIMSDHLSVMIDCVENELDVTKVANDHLHTWNHRYSFFTGNIASNNFRFEEPNTNLLSDVLTKISLPLAKDFQHYEHPLPYDTRENSNPILNSFIEAEEAEFDVVDASGTYRSLHVGGKYKVKSHEIEDELGKVYAIIGLSFYAEEDNASTDNSEKSFFNNFICIPDKIKPTPKRNTEKPRIFGNQTAFVTGPEGEEIFTDEHGRVKVKFHWDRRADPDENSSCFVRVSQSWAGNKFGSQYTPRIDQEVIVSFIEGDPDKPIITGYVYNGVNKAPFDYPDNKTKSGVKSRTTPDGSPNKYNEISLEDKKGKEEILIHAQRNMREIIHNNRSTTIYEGKDSFTLKKGDSFAIYNEGDSETKFDKGDWKVDIVEGNFHFGISEGGAFTAIEKGAYVVEVGEGEIQNYVAQGDYLIALNEGDMQTDLIKGDYTVLVKDGVSLLDTSDGISMKSKSGSQEIDDDKVELKLGSNLIKIDSGEILLKCGTSEIKLDTSGVTINGMMLNFEGTATANITSPMTTVNADGLLTLKGAMTMIN